MVVCPPEPWLRTKRVRIARRATPTAEAPVGLRPGFIGRVKLKTTAADRQMDRVYKYLVHSGPFQRPKMYENKLFSVRAPICFVCNQPVRLDNAKTDEDGNAFAKIVT